ncbi:MAG TPA: purine-nucleoside phosphorylase [Acidobacteriaceae bacterium]
MPESALDLAFQETERAAAFVRERIAYRPELAPRIAIVLGTGLGGFADRLTDPIAIPYTEIPHFPRPTVDGHAGRLVVGSFAGTPLAVMQGRVHAYEGFTPAQVIFPVRVLARLGIKTLIVTNAAGGIRADLASGQLVLISDHINFTGTHPLTGPNDRRLGERFFDLSDAYSRLLRQLAHRAAAAEGLTLPEGIYLGLGGPSFETPAEIRAFRILGADLVGMSTVHEVIAARHLGMEVLGFSSVTNMAAGVLDEPINHAEVMEIGARVQQTLTRVLAALVPRLTEL